MKISIRKEGDPVWYGKPGNTVEQTELVIEYGVTGHENDYEISLPMKELAEALAPYLCTVPGHNPTGVPLNITVRKHKK